MSAATIAHACAGEVVAGDIEAMASTVAIDSRDAVSGCVFFALPGERADGHEYVGEAVRAGARVVVVSDDGEKVREALRSAGRDHVALVKVPDVAAALLALAAHQRSRLTCPVIGITGSTGKTTTKDFLFAALAVAKNVVATEGNRNNELGVPLTLLRADRASDAVVVEMAMRGPGQIRELCAVALPTAGLVTNIGTSHIELLGTQEAIAGAKGELIECLPHDGRAFLNADDEWTARLRARSKVPVTTYGTAEDADVRASGVAVDDRGRVSFMLVTPHGESRVELSVPGRHNIYNAAAAAAVGLYLGLTLAEVVEGLECACGSPMRMEVFDTAGGVTVVNDAYNANPTSMRAALLTLADMRTSGRKIAVLGDMAELGSLSDLAHFRIGEQVARGAADIVVAVGTGARRIAEGARAEGMPAGSVHTAPDASGAVEIVRGVAKAGDIVLVKAARVMGLEAVVEGVTSS